MSSLDGPNPTAKRYVTEIGAMPRGQKSEGEPPLSNAERQARYRARHLRQPPHVVIRTRRPVDRRSRPQRWDDATNVLLGIQIECADWLMALPDSLRGTAMAEALEAIADLDLTALAEIRPPRGYGRD
jgi:hypothetical protein